MTDLFRALAICVGSTLLAFILSSWLDPANLVLVFLIGVVLGSAQFGRKTALFTACANVLAFDIFFVEPRGSLSVHDLQYLFTFALMLGLGLWIVQLTTGLRHQASLAQRRQERFQLLYEWTQEFSNCINQEQVLVCVQGHLGSIFASSYGIVILRENGPHWIKSIPQINSELPLWKFAHTQQQAIGQGAQIMPDSSHLCLPLIDSVGIKGVLILEPTRPQSFSGSERQALLKTYSSLLASAIQRIELQQVAQIHLAQAQTEQLRSTLLMLLSHDLKTPISALILVAENMQNSAEHLDKNLVDIVSASQRIRHLSQNILDWVKFSGPVQLHLDWYDMGEFIHLCLAQIDNQEVQNFQLEIPADFPLVWMDALLVQRVVINFMDNALKYAQPPYQIRIFQHAFDIRIEINDHYRTNFVSSESSHGLGLKLAQIIASHHQGQTGFGPLPKGHCAWLQIPHKTLPDRGCDD